MNDRMRTIAAPQANQVSGMGRSSFGARAPCPSGTAII